MRARAAAPSTERVSSPTNRTISCLRTLSSLNGEVLAEGEQEALSRNVRIVSTSPPRESQGGRTGGPMVSPQTCTGSAAGASETGAWRPGQAEQEPPQFVGDGGSFSTIPGLSASRSVPWVPCTTRPSFRAAICSIMRACPTTCGKVTAVNLGLRPCSLGHPPPGGAGGHQSTKSPSIRCSNPKVDFPLPDKTNESLHDLTIITLMLRKHLTRFSLSLPEIMVSRPKRQTEFVGADS